MISFEPAGKLKALTSSNVNNTERLKLYDIFVVDSRDMVSTARGVVPPSTGAGLPLSIAALTKNDDL